MKKAATPKNGKRGPGRPRLAKEIQRRTVVLPKELDDRLNALADQRGEKLSETIRAALRAEVGRMEARLSG